MQTLPSGDVVAMARLATVVPRPVVERRGKWPWRAARVHGDESGPERLGDGDVEHRSMNRLRYPESSADRQFEHRVVRPQTDAFELVVGSCQSGADTRFQHSGRLEQPSYRVRRVIAVHVEDDVGLDVGEDADRAAGADLDNCRVGNDGTRRRS